MNTNYDAWIFSRLLCGHLLNGELESVSDPFRRLATYLNTLPTPARFAAWEAFLETRHDRSAIELALADIDIERPPPVSDADGEGQGDVDGWAPILLGTLPPAEPFPTDILPIPAREMVSAAARSIACPPDFVAVAILAAASGLIGRSVILKLKAGYYASASIYAALVGGPSSGKSPALRAILAPHWSIATDLFQQWKAAMDAWKEAPADERGEPPELVRLASTDPTTEALVPILAANPRGMTIAPDEMTKWVMSMDQYKGGKGGDRPFYLSAWGGEAVFIDRAKHMREPIAVPHPFITVIGGMTHGMLSSLSEGKGREDGFTARLLFSYPERLTRRYSEEGIPEAVAGEWDRVAQALWRREPRIEDGKPAPHIIGLTADAARARTEWCRAHYAEQEADGFPESMEGAWGKLEAYEGRLALILHLLNLAAVPIRSSTEPLPDVPKRIIDDAARLVAYFKSHALRVYASMDGRGQDGGKDVRALLGWIVRNNLTHFSKRDVDRNFDRFRDEPACLDKALVWMTDHHLIRPYREPETSGKPGRKLGPSYEVNPAVANSPRFRLFRRNPAP